MCERYSADVLNDFISRDIKDTLRKEIEGHIDSCESCLLEVKRLTLMKTLLQEIRKKEVITVYPEVVPVVLSKVEDLKKDNSKRLFGFIYKPIFAAAFSLMAVLLYNSFIMDKYISSLNITMDNIDSVESISEIKAAEPVVKFILSNEVAKEKKDTLSIMTLEFVNKVMQESSETAQLKDVRFLLNSEIERKMAERGNILNTLDKIVNFVVGRYLKPASLYASVETSRNNELIEELMSKAEKFGREKDVLIKKANDIKNEAEKAKEYYRLGRTAMKYFDYETAIVLFDKCLSSKTIDSSSVKFNIAWCKKQLGKFQEAREGFSAIDNKDLCKYQQADIYDREGKFDKAVVMFNELSKETENKEISSLSRFKEGYTYLYKLDDKVKAKEIFSDINNAAPGKFSSYAGNIAASVDTRSILAEEIEKDGRYSLLKIDKGEKVAYGAEGDVSKEYEVSLSKEKTITGKAYSNKVVIKKGGKGLPLFTRSGKLLKGKRGDWKAYDNLVIKYVFMGDKPYNTNMLIGDEESYGDNWENWNYKSYCQKQVVLLPGEHNLSIDLDFLVCNGGRTIDLKNLRAFGFYGPESEKDIVVYFQDIYLEKDNSEGKRREK